VPVVEPAVAPMKREMVLLPRFRASTVARATIEDLPVPEAPTRISG